MGTKELIEWPDEAESESRAGFYHGWSSGTGKEGVVYI